MTAGRQRGEAVLHLTGQAAPANSRQGPMSEVEAELGVLVADEVQNRQAGLVIGQPEATAELLEEDRGALRRPHE